MTLDEIIEIADRAYPDAIIGEIYEKLKRGGVQAALVGSGDVLAAFIVIELTETFDEELTGEEQIEEAERVISRAIDELQNVSYAFFKYTG